MTNTGYAHHFSFAKKIMTHKTGECPLMLLQLGLECFSPVMVVIGIFGAKTSKREESNFETGLKLIQISYKT